MDLLNTSNGRLIKNKKIDIVRLKKSVTFGHILFIFLITNTYKYLNYSYFFIISSVSDQFFILI